MGFKKTSVKCIKRTLKGLVLILALNTISMPVACLSNRCITPKANTIVFTSGKNDFRDYYVPRLPDSLMAGVIDFFMYTPVTLQQNWKGNRVYWCSNPNLEEFVEELRNPEYDNVILIGHGRKDSFSLKDGDAEASYLATQDLPIRTGEFYQYTCGNDGMGNKSLKETLFSKCFRSKTFDGILDPFTSYAAAWTGSYDIEKK